MTVRGSDSSFPQDVCYRRLLRYEGNHSRPLDETPMDYSLVSKISWSTVSKAFVRSSNTAAHIFHFSMFSSTSSAKVDKAETVECLGLKPYCIPRRQIGRVQMFIQLGVDNSF